jgi:hypothetical protein
MTDSAVKETTVSEHTRSPRIFNFVSLGADSLVYKAQNNVALKYASSDSDEEIRDNFARENSMYESSKSMNGRRPISFRASSAIPAQFIRCICQEGHWIRESVPTRKPRAGL